MMLKDKNRLRQISLLNHYEVIYATNIHLGDIKMFAKLIYGTRQVASG